MKKLKWLKLFQRDLKDKFDIYQKHGVRKY